MRTFEVAAGKECARSSPGSSPGFAGRRCRLPWGAAALSLLVSRSQACGSFGPAAGAEGAGLHPHTPQPPAAGGVPRGHQLPSWSLGAVGTLDRSSALPCFRQGLLLFSKCISCPEPPPAPPLPVGLSFRAPLRRRRTRPAGSAPAVDRPQASGQRRGL